MADMAARDAAHAWCWPWHGRGRAGLRRVVRAVCHIGRQVRTATRTRDRGGRGIVTTGVGVAVCLVVAMGIGSGGVRAQTDAVPLAGIVAYLDSLQAVQAPFTQQNSDGSTTTGVLSIARPGRARFEYDGSDALVLVGASTVAIFDPVSNTLPQQYPLRHTPLAHILARKVDLVGAGVITQQRMIDETALITLADPRHPQRGLIELAFDVDPIRLRGWVIENQLGERIGVSLGKIAAGVSFSPAFFSIVREIRARGLD